MKRILTLAAVGALAGCVSLPVAREPGAPSVTTTRAIHLARVRCLLVAPFENASDDPLAAEAATGTWVSGIDPNRTSVYPIGELRAVFKDTSLELPEGVSPSLALELAELIGADAALYGAVEGRSRGPDAALTITLRLAATGARDLLFARVVELTPRPDEPVADQVRRAILDASAPLLERLGVPGRKACFDRQRTDRLRLMAIAGEQRALHPPSPPVTASVPAPPPPASSIASAPPPDPAQSLPPPPEPPQVAEIGTVEILAPFPRSPRSRLPVREESAADLPESELPKAPEPPATVATPPPPPPPSAAAPEPPPAPAPPLPKQKAPRKETKVASVKAPPPVDSGSPPARKSLTVRQADLLTKLQRGARILVADVGFEARTARIEREGGLRDVAAAMAVATGLKLRIEGFVDASNDPDGDLRLSMEMARACGKRLIELGVARDQITWAGRGGESPILPNFTARGRMSNRRIELVPAQ